MGWGVHDYPSPPPEEPMPECPVCGAETDTFYRDKWGNIVGCEDCVDTVNAFDYLEDKNG